MMGLKDFTNKLQKAANDYKDQQEIKKADEEARKNAILAGNIQPIQVSVNLQPEETAYMTLTAKRLAKVEHTIEKTVGKTKKKGVVTRGVVGGVLLGPLGMVAGAATAGSTTNSKTIQETSVKVEVVDSGTLVFTDKRILFIGSGVLELPYSNILAYSFSGNKMTGHKLELKYQDMLPGEHYAISGEVAKDAELYFKGITDNLLKLEAPGPDSGHVIEGEVTSS